MSLISCRNCQTYADSEEELCGADCVGDRCYQSQFYYDDRESHIFTKSGCVIGSSAALGCRVNQDGQTMCICDTAFCNTNVSLSLPMVRLPVRICDQEERDGRNNGTRFTKACAGNYCRYKSNQYELQNTTQSSTSLSCSRDDDFDVFSPNKVVFHEPETCVLMEYAGHPREISCYGAQVIYSNLTFRTGPPQITCHVDFYSPYLPYIRTSEMCTGEVGFFLSPSGIEQWLCRKDRCNFDLNSAEASWDETQAQHRNISRLRQWNVFYILNGKGLTFPISWFFLVVLTVI